MQGKDEFYVKANTFAAPFFSDTLDGFIEADSADEALIRFVADCDHPAGVYSAVAYDSADAERKGEKHLAQWLCNHEIEKQRLTNDLGAYSYLGHGPGKFDIDGKRHEIESPKSGRVVEPRP